MNENRTIHAASPAMRDVLAAQAVARKGETVQIPFGTDGLVQRG